jgi:branched-chain amino acid transport system permease protein
MSIRRFNSVGELLVLASALVMLAAFLFLPWYELDDNGGTVTGYRIATDTAGDLDLAGPATHMFLIVIPAAAISAVAIAGWGLLASNYERRLPGMALLVGLVAIGYYYGAFFFENRKSSVDALDFVDSGFWVTLVAALGLIVQYVIPRSETPAKLSLTRLTLPPMGQARAWWGWPFTWLRGLLRWIRALFAWILAQVSRAMTGTPVLAYLVGLWAAVELEQRAAEPLAELLGFRRGRPPSLFGATELLEPFSKLDFSGVLAPLFPAPTDTVHEPLRQSWEAIRTLAQDFINAFSTQDPRTPGFFNVLFDVVLYDLLIYIIPILVVALLLRALSNRVLLRLPFWGGLTLQLVVLYLAVDSWGNLNDYRELVLIYMGVNIMLAVSLNLVNGYMGEFSVGHAGFMAVGAYVASVLTMWLFVDDSVVGGAVFSNSPQWSLTIGFFIALIAGGAAAALAGLLVAFPSFRTRGDYLAIVTLAVNFIVTGVINNIEAVGGPRGLNGVPLWTNLRWIFFMTVLSILAIHNLVTSTFGKGIIAIREDEIAAELMGVHTRRVKLVAFLVSSFIAGMSGGLFAHVLAYVNPGVFGILKSTEALVMVYLGGMGSISGSIIAAILFTILIEAFRPLAVLKWVMIPLILILLMIYRPQGLFGFREINISLGGIQDETTGKEATDDTAAD